MALFRFYTGSLRESIISAFIINSKEQLLKKIQSYYDYWPVPIVDLKIAAYPSVDECFDKRIGWFTHSVIAVTQRFIDKQVDSGSYSGDYFLVGYLSEPLNE